MRTHTIALFSTLIAAGCLGAVPQQHDTAGGNAGNPTGPSPGGDDVNPTSPTNPTNPTDPSNPAACGAQTFPITISSTPPNIYLLVDRSGSMSDAFGGVTSGTKWDAAQTALNNLLTTNAGKAAWGLSVFPPNPTQQNNCTKAVVDVGLAMGSEAAIKTKINSLTNAILGNPRGATPTADALKTVRDSANLTATDRNNYLILMTDGIPQCNNASDVPPVLTALYSRTPSVKTFIIGVGSETASNPTLLNDWADKGHTARVGAATKYYQANDGMALVQAFESVVGQTASCTFKLQTPPPDASLVVGSLDGVQQASDAANGFTYDGASQSIVFHGAACDKIQTGVAKTVGVVYGCPPTQIL